VAAGMQRLRLDADAQARLVEAAHARGADEGADLLGDRRKRRRVRSATLAAQRPSAPVRSASASAVRSSGINCRAWR